MQERLLVFAGKGGIRLLWETLHIQGDWGKAVPPPGWVFWTRTALTAHDWQVAGNMAPN